MGFPETDTMTDEMSRKTLFSIQKKRQIGWWFKCTLRSELWQSATISVTAFGRFVKAPALQSRRLSS